MTRRCCGECDYFVLHPKRDDADCQECHGLPPVVVVLDDGRIGQTVRSEWRKCTAGDVACSIFKPKPGGGSDD